MKRVIILASILGVTSLFAQGFEMGKTYVGPMVGYAWGTGFGGGVEYGIKENMGVGLDVSYTSFTEDWSGLGLTGYEWKYTLLGALASGSYHFSPGKVFDPFIKVGVGYFKWDAKFKDSSGNETNPLVGVSAAYTSGVGFGGQVGARYFFSPTMAGKLALGWPFYISGGLDFAF
ncbi:MAG: outer membrane beta-barrel protein [bacterium]